MLRRPVCLPQNDLNPAERAERLAEEQPDYYYDYTELRGFVVGKAPLSAGFSPKYLAGVLHVTKQLYINATLVKGRWVFDDLDTLNDFDELFPRIRIPSVRPTWYEDWCFARQRIDGVNPVVLCLVAAVPPAFQPIAQQVEAERADQRLYHVAYPLLQNTPNGVAKYLPQVEGLFRWTLTRQGKPVTGDVRGEFEPVAIAYLDANGAARIATPASGAEWNVAKLLLQVADSNHHEMSTHLARTHMAMDPFGVSTPRQLARNHPVRVLLKPHLRLMLSRNGTAREMLINPGGYVDDLLGSTLDGSLEIVENSLNAWRLSDSAFPVEIASRGVSDVARLPDYPFRDDGMLVWEATRKFVEAYIHHYYTSNTDVSADPELRAWADELRTPGGAGSQGGRVRGLLPGHDGDTRPITTREELVGILTTVIFTCGPLHSAVNSPQWDYIAHTPNMPLAVYRLPDRQGPWDVLDYLPASGKTMQQIEVMGLLSLFQYDVYADYDRDDFDDRTVWPLIDQFRADLATSDQIIHDRNRRRKRPYRYFLRSTISNSLSA